MTITYYGHASLGIETAGKRLVVDPFISKNELAQHIDWQNLAADYILLTHAHWDHVLDVEPIAARTGAQLISNAEIVDYYAKRGLKGHPMNHGGQWNFDFGLLQYVHAIHSSGFADGTYGGNPGGFVLQSRGKTLYIAGDTALSYDMKMLGTQWDFDLLVLPIGDNFTMGYATAVTASGWLGCPRVLGYHYDTFGYIEIDHQKAQAAFASKGKALILLPIGSSLAV